MFIRLTEEEIERLDDEYSRHYVLYNSASTVVEQMESSKRGLRAPEVWKEVLALEERLPQRHRMDRAIALEWTNLRNKFSHFKEPGSKDPKSREPQDAERSVLFVMLVLGMRLAQFPDDQENPYEDIMQSIQLRAAQYEDKEELARIVFALYDEEDEEEERGFVAPEEDVLGLHFDKKLSPELQRIQEKMRPIIRYFRCALESDGHLSPDFSAKAFETIWEELLQSERMLREFMVTYKVSNTIGDRDPEAPDEVRATDYNLKLILNIIGVMLTQKVIQASVSATSKLFFSDSKDIYFKENEYTKFGERGSAFRDQAMLDQVVEIIEKYRNT